MRKRYLSLLTCILSLTLVFQASLPIAADDDVVANVSTETEAAASDEQSADADHEDNTSEIVNNETAVDAAEDDGLLTNENDPETASGNDTQNESENNSSESESSADQDQTADGASQDAEQSNTEEAEASTSDDESEATPVQYQNKVVSVKATGEEYLMFPIDESTITDNGDGTYAVKLHAAKATYTGFYFGYTSDETKTMDVSGTADASGEIFEFTIPAGYLGTYRPVTYWNSVRESWVATTYYLGFKNLADDSIGSIPAEPTTEPTPTETPAPEVTETPTPTPDTDPTTTPDVTPDPTITPEPTDTPDEPDDTEKPVIPSDGVYQVDATCDALMFRIVNAVLTVKAGKMTVAITLSGQGYDYLYAGSSEQAVLDKENWVGYTINSEGKYVYTLPLSSLDTPVIIGSHGASSQNWFDRTVTFSSSSLVLIPPEDTSGETGGDSSGNNTSTTTPTPTPTPTAAPTQAPVDTTADAESEYTSDLTGSTSAVDSSTALADGVYTPDSFSFSGGTGKVTITCSKITVTGGNAYATIVFSSSKYGYVKANGNTYYPTVGSDTTTFVIPVTLNTNNTIIGMTTAMSAAHEITYSIFIYLNAANETSSGTVTSSTTVGTENTLDEEAPTIAGLTVSEDSEVATDEAEYLKIFKYENGITLIEIDTVKDTVLDPDYLASQKTDEKSEKTSAKSEDTSEEETSVIMEDGESASDVKTTEQYIAELYQADVIKYLVVPEGAEIPAGLEKQVIVINIPKTSAYITSDNAVQMFEKLGIEKYIKALGTEEKDCDDAKLLAGYKDETIAYAGTYDSPKYKQLVKSRIDIAFEANDIIPLNENALKERSAESKAAEELSSDEYKERFDSITERFALLGIPLLVDRAADEKSELGKAQWIRVYGIIFGMEDEAETIYAQVEQEIKEAAGENS